MCTHPSTKKAPHFCKALILSGWQDSNLRPPAPKAGALTGLRYTPNIFFYYFSKSRPSRLLCRDALTGLRYTPKISFYFFELILFSAERGGFEPPVQVSPHAGLANRWIKPLSHLSLKRRCKSKKLIYICK